ncbi:MAG: zf-HC2 domain-containing protein [Ruminococcus sp.]|nr:zf-HC2 domain-containing protein [Ruminococcus sp.]
MSKNEISCNTIIDLLPLYKEGICSEETTSLVEEHLRGCNSCRSLSDAFVVPEPERRAVPDEAETFKKVGKKLKRSRFTKVMAVLMCVCIALFGTVNAAWYFLKYRPMKQMCEGMYQVGTGELAEKPSARKVPVYVCQDENYFYVVRLPHYLNFTMGTVTVAPVGALTIDDEGMNCYHDTTGTILSIPHKIFGADCYFVDAEISGTTEETQSSKSYDVRWYNFETDTELSEVLGEAPSAEMSDMNGILEAHRDELAAMKQAAMDKWGEYLK